MQLHAGSWTCRFLVKAQPPDLTCEDVRAALCNAPWQHLGSGGQGSVYGCELGGAGAGVASIVRAVSKTPRSVPSLLPTF